MAITMSGYIKIGLHKYPIEENLPGALAVSSGPAAGEKLEKKLEIDLSKITYEPVL
jgi:hypothetical protein